MKLHNRAAIVTGAQRGLGLTIATRFLGKGATVVLMDILGASRQARDLTNAGGTAAFIQTDVSNADSVQYLFDQALTEFGSIDNLVNNAGIEFAKTAADTSEQDWDKLIAFNLKGVFLCSNAVILR